TGAVGAAAVRERRLEAAERQPRAAVEAESPGDQQGRQGGHRGAQPGADGRAYRRKAGALLQRVEEPLNKPWRLPGRHAGSMSDAVAHVRWISAARAGCGT